MPDRPTFRIGIDTGGTFTDLVVDGPAGRLHAKVPSSPEDPAQAFGAALARAGVVPGVRPDVRHGTTVGTNAVLTRSGARVVFVGTHGHEDALQIGRGVRDVLFALQPGREPPLVAAADAVPAPGRLAADGSEVEALEPAAVARLVARVRRRRPAAIAVALLHATRAPAQERAVVAALEALGVPVSCGTALSAEPREVERARTAVLDAYVAPLMRRYMERLAERDDIDLTILRSDGGRMRPAEVAAEPVRTLVSGPAAGAVAAADLARRLGLSRAIGFDVGGTSTDVVWIEDGEAATADALHVGPWRAGVASLAIETVGAGGGSVVALDAGGALTVGPGSAGATPGPAAYGHGGPFTLTDAWVLLGRLPAALAEGAVALDPGASQAAAAPLAQAGGLALPALAAGAVAVGALATARALRAVSARRGRDPREAVLIAFGGAGPLLGADAAEALGMRHVVVPPAPGTFAAAGTLLAPLTVHLDEDVLAVTDVGALEARAAALAKEARARLQAVGVAQPVVHVTIEARHAGQEHGVTVPFDARYAERARALHRARFGFELSGRAIEPVRLFASASGRDAAPVAVAAPPGPAPAARARLAPRDGAGVAVTERATWAPGETLDGPARVEEATATTWVPAGWTARLDGHGVLHLERRP